MAEDASTSGSLPSHKRTSSTAQNTTAAPESKRQAQTPSNQYVYIVILDMSPMYGDGSTDNYGIYATIEDANNAAIGLVAREYEHAEDCTRGFDKNGGIHWYSEDVGEGDGISITVQKWLVKPPGSEPEREWEDDGSHEEGEEEEGSEDT